MPTLSGYLFNHSVAQLPGNPTADCLTGGWNGAHQRTSCVSPENSMGPQR